MSAENLTNIQQPSEAEAVARTLPKVEARFDPERMSLLLGLEGEHLDPGLSEKLTSHGFEPKEDLHMTAIGFKNGRTLVKALKAMPDAQRQVAMDTISSAAQNTDWNITPNGQFFGLEKQYDGEETPRRSLVEMVDCPQLGEFYGLIGSVVPGLDLEVPLAHITLGTEGNPSGVRIDNVAELQQFGQSIEL